MPVIYSKEFPNIELKKTKNFYFLYFKKRKIGFLKKGIFWKIPLDPNKHIFKKWNSIGIEAEIIEYLKRIDIKTIAISFDGVQWYKVPTNVWATGKTLEYGGIVQKHLSIEDIKRFSEVVYMEDWKKTYTLNRWF